MKGFIFALSVVMLAFAFVCADVSANGGVAIVRRPIVARQRVVVQRQRVVVAHPQAIVLRQHAPLVVAPLVQQYHYVQPQAVVVPQVQAFSSGCQSGGSASLFFSY